MRSINVWDLPTRLFHWTLAGSVILALIIIEDEGLAYTIHAILGVTALVLVLFRIVWGFAGNNYARFREFVVGWTPVRSYIGELLRLAPPRSVGHNPLGGWAVVVLLVLTFVTAISGAITGGLLGPAPAHSAKDLHEAIASLLQIMVFVHVAGVLIDWALTRDNLVAAMWHGRKQVATDEAAADARGGSVWLAVAIAVPLLVLGGVILNQIDLVAAPGEAGEARDGDRESERGHD